MYRLFVEKGISPYEVENSWTLAMVLDANDALDVAREAERRAHEAAKKEK